MLYYLILAVICLFSLLLYKKYNYRIFKILPFVTMSFFCGFRASNVGIDTSHYIDFFDSIAQNIPVKAEYGYLFIVKLVQYVGGSQQLVFVIISALTSFFIYRFIDYESSNFELSTIIYLGIGPYYFSSYNTIRQALAISIFLYSLRYINKDNMKYIFCIFLSCMFHTSALLFLILIPINKYVQKKFYIYGLISVILFSSIVLKFGLLEVLINSLLPQYKNYVSGHYQTMDFSYIIFLLVCLFIFMTYYFDFIEFKPIHIHLLLLAICFVAIPLITNQFTMIFTRIASYVTPILIVTIPKYEVFIKKKNVFNILIGIVCLSYYFLILSRNGDMNIFNFNFFLF